jgi:hypothetical protein
MYTSKATRNVGPLDKHMAPIHQLKRVLYHPELLDILLTKLDEAIPAKEEITDDVVTNISNLSLHVFNPSNEAELQVQALAFLHPIVRVSSVLSFLLEETSQVHPLYPIEIRQSDLITNKTDHAFRFNHQYCEYFLDVFGKPLEKETQNRVKRLAAAGSYLK